LVHKHYTVFDVRGELSIRHEGLIFSVDVWLTKVNEVNKDIHMHSKLESN
jgi:hypothetical protein